MKNEQKAEVKIKVGNQEVNISVPENDLRHLFDLSRISKASGQNPFTVAARLCRGWDFLLALATEPRSYNKK
ncbi:hypothetical protein [Pseudescherichia vulneris]|uniref:hypothetical protein n=1 Tax=Pseudescherichia vulneris TaxID=566 RepID=UPI001EDE8E23|nr:hypothetical protein [Pseudescherichia vulneris]